MTCPSRRLSSPLLQWGARRVAPLLFSALLLASAAAGAQTVWHEADIRHSRTESLACTSAPAAPLTNLDLIVAVREAGRQLLLLDAATLAPRGRCQLPHALQDAPLRSPDGRYVYAAAAGGWVLRLDLQDFGRLLAVRSGLALSGLALSADGRWLLAGHAQPHSLVLLDAQLEPVRSYRTGALAGGPSSAVAQVWHTAARQSFIVSFDALPELWELSYDPAAAPIFDGLVHDYRMGEAVATAGFLGVRRAPLEHPLQLLLGDATLRHVAGIAVQRAEAAHDAGAAVEIINLDIRRRITARALPQRPLAHAGLAFAAGPGAWLAFVLPPEGRVVLMDTRRWTLQQPPALAVVHGVSAVRSHPEAPQLWLLAGEDAPADTLLLLDKTDWRLLARWQEAGMHWTEPAFAAGGRVAVLAARGAQGSVRLVDTHTLQQRARVPLPQVEQIHALDAPSAP